MLVLTLRENDGGVEIETDQGKLLIHVLEIRALSVRVGLKGDESIFRIARANAILKFPKQPGDDGPKAA